MYWQDHAPPHFHAFYSGHEAQIRITDGVVPARYLPATATRLVTEWTALHRAELHADWDLAQLPEAFLPIEGLR
jgi:hypothetical protein